MLTAISCHVKIYMNYKKLEKKVAVPAHQIGSFIKILNVLKGLMNQK